MEATEKEEEPTREESAPTKSAAFREAWQSAREEIAREFEEYLQDIGVRF